LDEMVLRDVRKKLVLDLKIKLTYGVSLKNCKKKNRKKVNTTKGGLKRRFSMVRGKGG